MNDIEVLEDYIYNKKETMKEQLVKAIENLLKERQSDKERIKELEKEKEDLLCDVYDNFIRKSLIKEKIEELKEQEEKTKPDDVMMIDYYETKIQVLEELLKGE